MIGLNGADRVLAVGPFQHGSNPARKRVIRTAARWRAEIFALPAVNYATTFNIPPSTKYADPTE